MNSLIPMTRVLDAALNSSHRGCEWHPTTTAAPRADILEGEKEFRILLDLPGVRNEDLEINVEHQNLQVKAERKFDVPEGFESRRGERSQVTFERSFRLGNGVDTDGIGANFKDGVLVITLPKSEQSLPRKIEVN